MGPSCQVAMADTQSEEGVLTFGEPGIRTTPALTAEYSVRPREGALVLFPSYFLTVAFDAVPDR